MIIAIVQARMSSTRLPGKVMKEINERPLIGHLLERLSYAKKIDKIILATSVLPGNDCLCEYVKSIGVDVYKGSEDDVLDRFYQAVRKYDVHGIVRITGDCPLIDPAVCDEVIEIFEKEKLDYVNTGPTFAEGLDCEVFTTSVLEKIWKTAKRKSEREHIMLYVHNHPEEFKKKTLINKSDDSKYRLSVDQEEDFFVVKTIIEELSVKSNRLYTITEIKEFLDNHPEIFKANAHIIRNEGLIISSLLEKEE